MKTHAEIMRLQGNKLFDLVTDIIQFTEEDYKLKPNEDITELYRKYDYRSLNSYTDKFLETFMEDDSNYKQSALLSASTYLGLVGLLESKYSLFQHLLVHALMVYDDYA